LASGRKDIDAKLASEKSQLTDVESQLSSKQKELASVSGQVEAAKGAPKTLTPGSYHVGQDIPAGRYIAVACNFILRN
jgi:hypothetical protein